MSDTDQTGSDDVVSVERVIPADAGAIFALLADPSRHHEIDGSGTVRDAKTGSQQLALGATFGMSMKMGIPYSMVSEVVEFEPDRRIAWQTRGPGRIGQHVAGRIWRYELEPVDGGTLVRESWDIRQESPVSRPFVRRLADQTRKNMAATLERIESVLT
ncbi:SRPBCC family protein [Rhabdothermincola salaria]|uniref:SRPBCC family protein n=1 Tax=Rhabdothermincola salaria TaxID=2903142 RepID=UPI001E379DF4|nr:SRPBCC family protein [Rhabdothermincola salaria]MCD9625209.1 SRPBCC family protein [Rhabdothermincola salaria]